jgi:hypothetical protein
VDACVIGYTVLYQMERTGAMHWSAYSYINHKHQWICSLLAATKYYCQFCRSIYRTVTVASKLRTYVQIVYVLSFNSLSFKLVKVVVSLQVQKGKWHWPRYTRTVPSHTSQVRIRVHLVLYSMYGYCT